MFQLHSSHSFESLRSVQQATPSWLVTNSYKLCCAWTLCRMLHHGNPMHHRDTHNKSLPRSRLKRQFPQNRRLAGSTTLSLTSFVRAAFACNKSWHFICINLTFYELYHLVHVISKSIWKEISKWKKKENSFDSNIKCHLYQISKLPFGADFFVLQHVTAIWSYNNKVI